MKLPKKIREAFAEAGRKGGQRTAMRLTKKQRQGIARKAAQARWARKKKARPEE